MKKISFFLAGCLFFSAGYAQQQPAKTAPSPPAIPNESYRQMPQDMDVIFQVTVENNEPVIYVTKDGKMEKITMKDWEANKAKYEKMYGVLPPPPPPVPAIASGDMAPPPPPLPPVKKMRSHNELAAENIAGPPPPPPPPLPPPPPPPPAPAQDL